MLGLSTTTSHKHDTRGDPPQNRCQPPVQATSCSRLPTPGEGIRVGEALRLDRSDIDRVNGVLVIRKSKFGKSRFVPVLPSTLAALDNYTQVRDRLLAKPATPSLFVSVRGTRADLPGRPAGIPAPPRVGRRRCRLNHRPRIHGLRHTFAVRTLMEWYRTGQDIEARLPVLSTYLGHRDPRSTYWYLSAAPELLTLAAGRAASVTRGDHTMSLIASTLQSFFTDRLVNQRRASSRTIASYRDSLRLLVVFVHNRTGKTPSAIDWDDLNVESISAFLDHLETGRGNGTRTRNLRLTAIRSLFAYASLRHPEHAR